MIEEKFRLGAETGRALRKWMLSEERVNLVLQENADGWQRYQRDSGWIDKR